MASTTSSETALLIENEDVVSGIQVEASNQPQITSRAPTSSLKRSKQPNQDFAFIKIIARITIRIVRKFWALSSAACLAIILFYWLCGGFFAFLMVLFALSGLLYHSTDRFLYHPDEPNTARVYVPSPSVLGKPN